MKRRIIICFHIKRFDLLTFLIGRRKVSVILSAGGLRGFELGVCTLQILIKVIINTIEPMPIRAAAHQ